MAQEKTELSSTDKALKAAILYSEDNTFQDISDEIGVSKSFAQELLRRGLKILLGPLMEPQRRQMPETYNLEIQGIPREITLKPQCLMIYDLWGLNGFKGSISDFLEYATDFLYNSLSPQERMLHARVRVRNL